LEKMEKLREVNRGFSNLFFPLHLFMGPSGAALSSSALLRLKPLAQRDDLCGQFHVVYPGRYSCGSVSAVFTCREKTYIAKQKEETWIGQFNMCCGV
jgi:hypothetical protein